ncbi:SHOCT domain-containing protein [Clostridium sp. DJ247]|nr:SHOCT domain-containing protein [Clostridium sp. DJ247]
MLAGCVFVLIGILGIMPNFGLFGLCWTLIAIIITASQAYNFFNDRRIASWELNIETDKEVNDLEEDFDTKLRKIKKLREDGIITEEEFQNKRNKIINEKW